jgi:flavin reductase (DIM6/NTAB) family NADH-FMN oxidoreductase RutF
MSDQDPQKQLAAALGRVPSGLFILTVRNGDSETGMLASWVQQCSFEPPRVSVALGRTRPITTWLPEGALFALNILDDTQTDMISHFGRGFELGQPAFTGIEVSRLPSGLPVLDEALAYLECQVAGRIPTGDHDLFLGQVVGGRLLAQGQPMVHVRKSGAHY